MKRELGCLALLSLVLIACGSESPESCTLTASLSMREQSNLSEVRTFEAGLASCERFFRVNSGAVDAEITTTWNKERLQVAKFEVAGASLMGMQVSANGYRLRIPLEDFRAGTRLRISSPPSTSGDDWPTEIHIVFRTR